MQQDAGRISECMVFEFMVYGLGLQQDAGRISEYMVFGLMVNGEWCMVYGCRKTLWAT